MGHRKSRLKLDHQDLAINADVRTTKLDPEDIADRPEIIRRDARTGDLVVRQIYDKASGDPLEEGYGYRWVTEDGTEVPAVDIELYAIEDEEERRFSKHEPTIGADRTVSAVTWIPVAQVDEFLVESVYELWGETTEDDTQLHELAEHVRDFDQAPAVEFLLQPAIYRQWGIITPVFYEESFALIVRVTQERIEPEHQMPTEPEETGEITQAAPTLEQESPFE